MKRREKEGKIGIYTNIKEKEYVSIFSQICKTKIEKNDKIKGSKQRKNNFLNNAYKAK